MRPATRCVPLRLCALVALLLLTLPGHATAAEETADVRLGRDVLPRFQSVRLKLDPDKRSYSGSVRVELDVTRATDTVRFHAEGQKLTRVTLLQGKDTVACRRTTGDRGLQTLVTARPLAKGPAVFEAEFTHLYGTAA